MVGCRSRYRLGVLEGVVHGLDGARDAGDDAPSIIVLAEADAGAEALVGRVECGADFIHGRPLPGEFDDRGASLFADAGYREELALGNRDCECGLVVFGSRGYGVNCVDT
jgi:hypothetical protein